MKRPAAATSSAASLDMTDFFKELKKIAVDQNITYGNFTTRAYKRGEKLAKMAGMSDHDVVDFARQKYADAAKLWATF